jgi:CheY-like chemotaxis protein
MAHKRALIVDDSRSARLFLARILEKHEIDVDSVDSAEAAIGYLANRRPDVIFMDHMMPGMDGFQAVQSIKNNPRTSAIPILMYTSQEGDLYLGQARALGAEGVLPKQIKQADVTRMLYQLQLVADRRGGDRATFANMTQPQEMQSANESQIIVTPVIENLPEGTLRPGEVGSADVSQLLPQMSLEIRAALDGPLQQELTALRSFISASLDAQSELLQGNLATLVQARRAVEIEAPAIVPERRSRAAIAGWCLALLSAAGAGMMSWLWWQQGGEIAAIRTDLSAAYAEVESLRSRPPVVSPAPAPADATGLVPADDALDPPAANGEAVSAAGVTAVPTGPAAPASQAASPAPGPSAPAPGPTAPVSGAAASPGVSTAAPVAVQAQ